LLLGGVKEINTRLGENIGFFVPTLFLCSKTEDYLLGSFSFPFSFFFLLFVFLFLLPNHTPKEPICILQKQPSLLLLLSVSTNVDLVSYKSTIEPCSSTVPFSLQVFFDLLSKSSFLTLLALVFFIISSSAASPSLVSQQLLTVLSSNVTNSVEQQQQKCLQSPSPSPYSAAK
jgi:hypothetical protein